MTKKIRIARSGYNAITETDPNNLIFDSSLNTFKILAEGTITNQSVTGNPTTVQVAHGQSSIPAVFAFVDLGDGYVALPSETDYTFTLYGGRYYLVDIDGTYVFFKFYKGSDVSSTTGPYRPNTADDYAAIGTISWSNPTDALTSNNAYATAVFASAATSHYLRITNLGFTVPSSATIDGIILKKEGHYTSGGSFTGTSYAQLLLNGEIVGSSKSGNFPSTTDGVVTSGSSSDMWGYSFTPAIVNSSGFGVSLWTDITAGSGTIYVDSITIEVYYTIAAQNYTVSGIKYYIFETPLA